MQAKPTTEKPNLHSPSSILRFLWVWFWRLTLVISLSYAWYCYYVPSNEIAWAKDYTSAQQVAQSSGKPLILFFTGKWCVPCRIMKRTVWANAEVESVVNMGFTPVMIDVGDPSASAELLEQYSVHVTPVTILLDSDGQVLERVQGAMDKQEFLALLQKSTATPISRADADARVGH
ncbi:MAG: thioredoxin family protein [bacterium]|nr:thioredoxin family protein [bacterium]